MMRIGVDLGGTKIEAIALNDKGEVLFRERTPTPQNDYEGIIKAIAKLVADTELAELSEATVGIGIPGAISPATGLVKNANTVCLIGNPLQEDLEKALKQKVTIANDANCFAVSEAVDGAAAGADVVFGVIIGTGTGGGIAFNQKAIAGKNAISGEWGHNPLPWPTRDELPGPDCYCGKKGCIETWLSGPGFANEFKRVTGRSLTPPQIVKAAEKGDEDAKLALKRYERRMAKSLASVINVIDPDVIVLGGGMSNIKRLYQNVPKIWGDYVFSDEVSTILVPPKHGDSSGVRGAAWL